MCRYGIGCEAGFLIPVQRVVPIAGIATGIRSIDPDRIGYLNDALRRIDRGVSIVRDLDAVISAAENRRIILSGYGKECRVVVHDAAVLDRINP